MEPFVELARSSDLRSMSASWDTRVVPGELLNFVRTLQASAPCRLAGDAVLSGVHLRHRLSRDLDLFCDTSERTREAAQRATELEAGLGGQLRIVRDGGTFIRAQLTLRERTVEVDIAHEPSVPLAPRDEVEGIPTAPLPVMLEPLTEAELARFRNDLVDRFRAAALPSS